MIVYKHCLICLGCPNGKGYVLGVKSWMRLLRHMFCLPIDGRIERKDFFKMLKEQNKEAKEAESSVRVQILNFKV